MRKLFSLLIIVFISHSIHSQTFWQLSGLADSMITTLSINSQGKILAGTTGEVLYLSDDNGDTWKKIAESDIVLNFICLDDSDKIYIADTDAFGNGLQISTDLGANWKAISDSTTLGCYSLGVKSPGEIFATFTGVNGEDKHIYHSSNYGNNWERDSIDFNVALLNNLSTQSVYAFNKKGFLFVIGNNGIYRSTDNGNSWIRKVEGLPAWIITTICINQSDNIFVQGNFITTVGGLYKSTDDGDNWELINTTGLPAFPDFYQLVVDSNNVLYGITNDVFRSKDDGVSWDNVSEGLPGGNNILAVSPNGDIYCGTNSGVYKSTSFLTSVENDIDVNINFSLNQNYPNPFNSMTRIEYHLTYPANVKLKIYDVLGEEILTLVNDYKQAGDHKINFDASELSSGIYFYKLQAGVYTNIKKMILLK